MKTILVVLALSIAGLSACKKAERANAPSAPPATGIASPSTAQLDHAVGGITPAAETKYFRGSIGSALGLQMKLVRDGDTLTGSYFYQKVGTRIDLKGTIDKDGNIAIEEFDPSGKPTGIFKGLWTVNADDGMVELAGNWTRPDGQKKAAFSLHQEPINFSSGGAITAKSIKDANKKLKYEIDVEYPQLSGMLSSGIEKFNQEASRFALRQVSDFKKSVSEDSGREEIADESSLPDNSLGIGYTVSLTNDDLISIQFDIGTYFRGSAHPNSHSEVLNFDVKNGKTLKLADLFKPGAKYLQGMSAFAIKDLKQQSKAKGEDGMLDDSSIESGAAPSAKNYDSWTITQKGLGINFDAYQVGPYVAGPQYVLVPYSVLKDLIEPNGPIGGFVK
jgi:Protein of unknown function (DUF3298)/Deacetylase PdaC